MNLKTIYNKITGDIRAVSPVVATLVLIVVAIVGASAVGVMTGAFADQVGDNSADPAHSGQTLILAGSTTVSPVATELARAYMLENPGVRIIVQSVGSGTGVRAVGLGTVDIGMSSSNITETQFRDHPEIVGRVVTIGNSTVLLVGNNDINLTELNNITRAQLRELFRNDVLLNIPRRNATTGDVILGEFRNITGVFRSDRSGTGDTFAREIADAGSAPAGHDNIHATPNNNVIFREGNSGVFAAIRDTPGAIGGIDIGFAVEGTNGVRRSTNSTAPNPLRFDRPLLLITNGAPSALEQAFIDFARTPGAVPHFQRVGVTSIATLPS